MNAPLTAQPDHDQADAAAVRAGATSGGTSGGGNPSGGTSGGGGDLMEVIEAYNQVTEKLQRSHETLQSEVVRLRQELASKDAQLQRSRRLSALGEMAAGIAHEIRNPLAAISLYASMATDDLDDLAADHGQTDTGDSARDSTQKIASAVHGLSAIVNDVLSFARQADPEPASLAVADVLDRAVAAHQPAIDQARVTVERCIEPADLRVDADASQLQQVLLNLVRNAVDAMADREGDRRLTLAAADDDAGVTLRIADTGPGIDGDAVDRVFNPFFTTRNTGTGLGLAIVHRIVDAHGGAIAVNNDPQTGGAVFELLFPRPQPQSESARNDGASA